MAFFNRLFKKKNKTLVIGIDGLPFTLLQNLIKENILPNIKKITAVNDNLKQMDASIPEISSVSWSSFMTGKNPGEHGIYGFSDLKEDSYKMYYPSLPHLKAPCIWDKLGERGLKTTVINLPSTYPAREINGTMVSGFVAVDINKAVYPASALSKLKEIGYRLDVDTAKAREDLDYLITDLNEILRLREKAFDIFWKEDWDLFIAVITETDRLQHFLMDAVVDESHRMHNECMEFYKHVDRVVGNLIERLNDNDTLIMMSDHGFTRIKQEVYINSVLKDNGFLSFNIDAPEGYESIKSESKAFALDPSRIYIHRKTRYPKGSATDNEFEIIVNELKSIFSSLKFNGEKIIKDTLFGKDIYSGPYSKMAPDIVLLSEDGYDLKGNIKKKEIFGRSHLTGMHTRDDAFIFSSGGLRDKRYHIQDVYNLILASLES